MRKKKPVENKYLEFARPMGEAVKAAREKAHFTQSYVSEMIGVDTRTVLNIENGNGNPTMEKLYPLVRLCSIDPRSFFYPEMALEDPERTELRLLLETCTKQEAAALIPIMRAVLDALRTNATDNLKIHKPGKNN